MTHPSSQSDQHPVHAVIAFYQAISPQSLDRIEQLYARDAHFKDPFNSVQGHAAIRRIFSHMYESVDAPAFRVLQHMAQDQQAFLSWDFTFRMRRFRRDQTQCIHGATYLQFNPSGQISHHRDYWDAAEELYEKIPLLGSLMRRLKRSASASL